jgi:hypothetical protein
MAQFYCMPGFREKYYFVYVSGGHLLRGFNRPNDQPACPFYRVSP